MFWVRWFYSLFERMRLKRKRTMFIHTNQPLITSFYIKKVPIFAELAMSQRWSAIFCAEGVWGGKSIGRVRGNFFWIVNLNDFLVRFLYPRGLGRIICVPLLRPDYNSKICKILDGVLPIIYQVDCFHHIYSMLRIIS